MMMGRPRSGFFLASYGSELFIGKIGFPFSPGVLLSVYDGLLLRVMYAGSRLGPRFVAADLTLLAAVAVDDGGAGATPLRGVRVELDGTLPRVEVVRLFERSSSRTRSSRLE